MVFFSETFVNMYVEKLLGFMFCHYCACDNNDRYGCQECAKFLDEIVGSHKHVLFNEII